MSTRRRTAAFTLVEMMVAMTLTGVLGSIIYLVAGEALASFSRNVSINRSYSDARMTIDRIAQTVATAGHTPILVDTNGLAVTATTPPTPPAAGIRFYRAGTQSSYKVISGVYGPGVTNKILSIQVTAGQSVPLANDLMTIGTLGYQGKISSVVISGTTYTLTMVNALTADCSPTPTAAGDFANPQQYAQGYVQVAYIVVGNQLRYYPRAKSVATDTATVFNNAANYQVVVNLASQAFSGSGTGTTINPLLPFSIVNPPTITVQLYALNPDYSNRSTAVYNAINSADSYTYMQSSLGPRSPVQVNSPY